MPTQDSSGEKNSEHHLFLLLKDNEGDGGDRKGGRIKHTLGGGRGGGRGSGHIWVLTTEASARGCGHLSLLP